MQPAAYDNSGFQTLTSNYAPSDLFPIGITRVIYTSRDPSGNTAISSFTVTVEGRIKEMHPKTHFENEIKFKKGKRLVELLSTFQRFQFHLAMHI